MTIIIPAVSSLLFSLSTNLAFEILIKSSQARSSGRRAHLLGFACDTYVKNVSASPQTLYPANWRTLFIMSHLGIYKSEETILLSEVQTALKKTCLWGGNIYQPPHGQF